MKTVKAPEVQMPVMLADHVLVKRDESEETLGKEGLLIAPEAHREMPMVGTVVAVGPGKQNEVGGLYAMDVTVGDRVYLSRYCGNTLKLPSDPDNYYTVVRQDEILMILPE